MKDFTRISAPEPTAFEWGRASDAMSVFMGSEPPLNRMEAGLLTALSMGIDTTQETSVELRRYEMAFAHALARNARDGEEAPSLSSHDWARSFLVDASIQREAEITLQSTDKAAASRHRWGASEVSAEVWSMAGVPPTIFSGATQDELKSMAAGRMHELSGATAAQVEVSIMAAMSPGSPLLEHGLENAAVHRPQGSGLPHGRDLVESVDRDLFGPKAPGPDHADMAALADRMMLARRAAEVGHRDARGLFDPTPGRNPFLTTPDAERRAERAVLGFEASAFGRTVAIAANSLNAIEGWNQDIDGAHRLKMAAARLLTTGPNPLGDEKADVRGLMADVYLQRAAEERLSGVDRGSARQLEILVSGVADSRESVRFTTLASERTETEAVARGRFDRVADARGIASGLRNATWRAGISGSGEIDRIIRQETLSLRAPGRPVSVAKGPRVDESPAVAMAIAARGARGR